MASSQGKNELRFADWMAALPGSIHRTPLTNLAIPANLEATVGRVRGLDLFFVWKSSVFLYRFTGVAVRVRHLPYGPTAECRLFPRTLVWRGSHDSFSFYIDEASPVGPEQPETVQNFVSVFGTVAKKLMRKWLATQTMNFTSQLEAGIRYFDLRISTKPRDPDNELYFAHGLFSAKVKEGLEEINAFLTDHPKEVVFLDFNHFYGMQKYHHEKLVQMLKDTYGNKMCPAIFAHEVSLQYLWEKEHQVLVFYHSPVALEVPFLWPGQMMPAPWANTTDPEKLIQFLQASITERRKKGFFFISQVVLTPKASTVVKGVASGLRETITERALPAMMQWVRTQKPGESGVNIITADFVELGDFISTVIKLNYALDEGEDDTT
ncbi:PI-PLC X domain-containing protein 3 [Ciconia boyciana]|uniref:PI-PLC X domain-containing protein 3 n=1 Tax=Ciconia boyciana TaxID=52775 RepID=UPI003BA0E412